MGKKRVLFVCVHNSARSQMAEAYLNRLADDQFEVESAGLDPGTINPYVVEVMKEEGVNLTGKKTNSAFVFLKEGRTYDIVVTVCDETSGQRCPTFPGQSQRMHWGFDDPSSFSGSDEEIKNRVREVRNLIKEKILQFIQTS